MEKFRIKKQYKKKKRDLRFDLFTVFFITSLWKQAEKNTQNFENKQKKTLKTLYYTYSLLCTILGGFLDKKKEKEAKTIAFNEKRKIIG